MKQFSQQVKAELEQRGYDVQLKTVVKNNGLELTGIMFCNNSSICPTIYLDDFFRDYENGIVTMDDICAEIIHIARKKPNIKEEEVLATIQTWDNAKQRVTYRLIGLEHNKEYLMNKPHRIVLDMAVIYQIQITEDSFIAITDDMMHQYQISQEELEDAAKVNTPIINPVKINSMTDILMELATQMTDECMIDYIQSNGSNKPDMYVISNQSKINGATTILYDDVLSDFADACGGDFAVLPSSVHECILLPLNGMEMDAEEFREMVTDINATQVPVDEVLTNSAYIYDSKARELKIA